MTTVRLVADDLTGALDTAAEFVGLAGPVPVFWAWPSDPLPRSAALDSGTRELAPSDACAASVALLPALAGAGIAYKKVDSLLRGPTLAELVAVMRSGDWKRCVLAPAFPYQGRATRGGRQFARGHDGTWSAVSGCLIAALQALGAAAQAGRTGGELAPGISVFDADTDADLATVAAAGRRAPGPVLWCGSGGLAAALAAGYRHPALPLLPRPILGLFGSDQAATAAQLAACGPSWTVLPHDGPANPARLSRRLAADGIALASFTLPPGLPRPGAAALIAAALGRLADQLDPPATLLAAGGETLRSLCAALGASHLEVQGRIVPGLPRSVLRGGRWNGVTVVSKSGAFGHPTLLSETLGIAQYGRTA